MAAKRRGGGVFRKGAIGVALWRGSKWVARKAWPFIEKRLAKKNRRVFGKALRRTRRHPRPA